MTHPANQETDRAEMPPELALAFAPVHKRAFGMATGAGAALLVALATVLHLVRSPNDPYPLSLLSEFFYGYTVSPRGILVGSAWAGFAAFTFGWFLAFLRNLTVATMLFISRTRAELDATRDFLDHI